MSTVVEHIRKLGLDMYRGRVVDLGGCILYEVMRWSDASARLACTQYIQKETSK